MSWASKIAGFFRKPAGVHANPSEETLEEATAPVVSTRFGGQTNRINREHWQTATGVSINSDLLAKLASTQARAAHEYGTSPDFQGVCNTFKDDVVGRNGPALQVISDDDIFNEAVEVATRKVIANPDPSGRFGGVEDMRTWVQGLLLAGSYYNVKANVKRTDTRITFGWRSVSAQRFITPANMAGKPDVAFGCKYDLSTGKPIEYYVSQPLQAGVFPRMALKYETIPAAAVQHVFVPIEAEQLTGVPMMASALDTSQEMRDLSQFANESLKNSAANSPHLQHRDPTQGFGQDPVPAGSIRVEPGQVGIAPPGYEWASCPVGIPVTEWLAYKHERAAELGRPIHMPVLVVLLSAGQANFATAQYAGTVYTDGVASVQGTIERRSLNPFVTEGIIPEVLFRNRSLRLPKVFELVWTWNVPAHANIEKFVKAIRSMVEDGLISPAQGSALLGYDYEKVVASRKKCADLLKKNDLPPAPSNSGNASQNVPAEEVDDEEDDDLFDSPGGRTSATSYAL